MIEPKWLFYLPKCHCSWFAFISISWLLKVSYAFVMR